MKHFYIWMVVAVVGCVFSGCMTTDEEERVISSHRSGDEPEKWVGKHSSELVAKWGPPHKIYDSIAVDGGKVLVWKHEFSKKLIGTEVTVPGEKVKEIEETYSGEISKNLTQHRLFKTDASGMIYRYEYSK